MIKTETIIFILSLAAACLAFIFEYIGFEPCPLCLYQRIVYYFVICLYPLYYFFKKQIKNYVIYTYRVVLFLGTCLATYHVLIEKQIINPSQACEGLPKLPTDLKLAMDFLEHSKSIAVCTVPTYVVPFLSLAELNLLFSLILLIISSKRSYGSTR
jgi:disulfide bond formation protein DsbB